MVEPLNAWEGRTRTYLDSLLKMLLDDSDARDRGDAGDKDVTDVTGGGVRQ